MKTAQTRVRRIPRAIQSLGINQPVVFAITELTRFPEERRYQAAYVDNDAVTTDWSATLTVIAHS